ncbi:MAG: helix-turn-helix transcriptional regulator [Candidatus Binatia bacterium]
MAMHPTPRRASLSPREKRMLRLLCDGLSDAEIAGRMSLGPDAVSATLKRIFGKIDTDRQGQRPAGRSTSLRGEGVTRNDWRL